MAFSLSSPLAKFLNGLEILLSKAQVSTAPRTSCYKHGSCCMSYSYLIGK